MTPDYPEYPYSLIDADILTYSIPFMFNEPEEEGMCLSTLDKKIVEIINKTKSDRNWDLFLTGSGNFRDKVAVSHKYKGTRKKEKPTHYKAAREHLEHEWGAIVVEGMEADDAIAICATGNPNTVICSLDKDLNQIAGWHYKWTVGQREDKLWYIDSLGYLELTPKRKLEFGGLKGLYAQMITGDKTDNIVGLYNKGDVFAFESLKDCEEEDHLQQVVQGLYQEEYGDKWEDRYLENWNLLYMLRSEEELDALELPDN